MEKIIRIDGRDVPFRATAAVPRLYRIKFGRDIMQDMKSIQDALEKAQNGEQPIPVKMLEVLQKPWVGKVEAAIIFMNLHRVFLSKMSVYQFIK